VVEMATLAAKADLVRDAKDSEGAVDLAQEAIELLNTGRFN